MELISDYINNNELRGRFNNLTKEVFGFDFEDWYQRGFWDDRCVNHSFFEDNQIVSNVSTTEFELIINGKKFNAIQIGTVMTKAEYRGKGLGIELINTVIDKYKSEFDFIYLFGHNKVWEYYKKQDFVPIKESRYSIEIKNPITSIIELRNLDLSNNGDLEIIIRLTKKRVPVSKTFGVINDTSIFLFYCLYDYSNHLFYSSVKDCLLIFNISEDNVVHLYDVLCEAELNFSDIINLISSEVRDIKRIEFHYTPTYPDIRIEPTEIEMNDKMFFKGNLSILPTKFKYPKIAHT
jgi:GNAT superfamily N-acetyltransferase